MPELVHADIFFFITSIAVVLLTMPCLVLFFYAVRILRDVRHITDLGRRKAEQLSEDLDAVREHVKREGVTFSNVVRFFSGFTNWFKKTNKKKSNK